MTRRFQSLTKLISEADLSALMEAARQAADPQELWDLAWERLSAPSLVSRHTAVQMFRQWHLDGSQPQDEPVVLAWHAFPAPQVRREILHLERCRHLTLLDEFVCTVMYPRLGQTAGYLSGVRRAWEWAMAEDAAACAQGRPAPHLGTEIRCALVQASV